MDSTKVVAALAANSCAVASEEAMGCVTARRYGACASGAVRDEVRRRTNAVGVARVARDLGVSTEAIARTIAGLQQAPGTIDRIAAKLSEQAA